MWGFRQRCVGNCFSLCTKRGKVWHSKIAIFPITREQGSAPVGRRERVHASGAVISVIRCPFAKNTSPSPSISQSVQKGQTGCGCWLHF
jgi:hypothetical protein